MSNNETLIWSTLKSIGLTDIAAAGVMGNLQKESGFIPANLQDSVQRKLGISDEQYTQQVDSGIYQNFVKDAAGYGLAQWTFYTRKQRLLAIAKESNRSIGDINVQLELIAEELKGLGLVDLLNKSKSVSQASDLVVEKFLLPGDQSDSAKKERATYGLAIYKKYATAVGSSASTSTSAASISSQKESELVVFRQISPCRNSPRNHIVDRITIHGVVGQVTAEELGGWFSNLSGKRSSNYAVDKSGRVGLYVPEGDRSWCSSSADNDNRAITIETANDATEPHAVNDAAYKSLIALCVDICKRYGKTKLLWFGDKAKSLAYQPKTNEMVLTVHRWFASTACPGQYLFERMGEIAKTVTSRLQPTVAATVVQNAANVVNSAAGKDVKPLTNPKETTSKEEKKIGDWSKEARDWATSESGGNLFRGVSVVNGEPDYQWLEPVTREQIAVLLYRLYQALK